MQIFLVFFAFLRIICHSTHRGNEGETCGRPAKDPRKNERCVDTRERKCERVNTQLLFETQYTKKSVPTLSESGTQGYSTSGDDVATRNQ